MSGISLNVDKERAPDSFYEKCLKYMLRFGPVPTHVAFIMDGNRRYARKADKDRSFGHSQGYGKLESVIEWCSQIGVNAVTTYAFSIENFKRSTEEVEYLLKLARSKADYLLENKNLLKKYNISVVFSGNLSLLPSDLRARCNQLMDLTRDNTGFICNICLAYTSSEELSSVASNLSNEMINGKLDIDEITPLLIDRCLSTSPVGALLPPVDVVVRTSGEVRLSDFLLWQSAFSMFAFVDTLWPDFSLWDFAKVFFKYKWHYSTLKAIKSSYYQEVMKPDEKMSSRQKKFVANFSASRAEDDICDKKT